MRAHQGKPSTNMNVHVQTIVHGRHNKRFMKDALVFESFVTGRFIFFMLT